MNKPIFRWTIGNVHPLGFEILRHSINNMRKLYGNTFEYVACCNNIDIKKLNINAEIIDCSKEYKDSLRLKPVDSKWKLYPPRLDISTHEIIMDNDVVFHKRFPKFDEFLGKHVVMICQGHGRQFGEYFNHKVPKGLNLNSGIYGIPPGYDLREKIEKETKDLEKWQSWWDDQGVLAAIFLNEENYIRITLQDVSICHTDYAIGKYGAHFCAANKGMSDNYYLYHRHKLF